VHKKRRSWTGVTHTAVGQLVRELFADRNGTAGPVAGGIGRLGAEGVSAIVGLAAVPAIAQGAGRG
jgi:hypothetical protein